MPVLLILGPLFGFAAIIALVAHGHKPALPKGAGGQNTQQYELDHGMPEAVVHQVLTALVHDQNPAQLQALGHELAGKYPLAASELYARAVALGAAKVEPAHHPGGEHGGGAAGEHAAHLATATPDTSEPALILQAAMRAYAQETDPVSLEGFAESIRERYPTAAIVMAGRADELRAAQHASQNQSAVAPPASAADAAHAVAHAGLPGASATQHVDHQAPSTSHVAPDAAAPPIAVAPPVALPVVSPLAVPAAAAPPQPATYVVQNGDTPSALAERLAHDGKRWPELVAANPSKPTTTGGNFVSMRPGETLNLPPSWGAAPNEAHP